MNENGQLVQFARGQMDRILARLRAGMTRTPRLDTALAQVEAATAELVGWAQMAPVRELGDSLHTPIGPWVRAVSALQAGLSRASGNGADAVVEGDHVPPRDTLPDTPLEEWIAGAEALLAELDCNRDTTD